MNENNRKPFFETIPGYLTGIAALIGAITTFYLSVLKESTKTSQTIPMTESNSSLKTSTNTSQENNQKESDKHKEEVSDEVSNSNKDVFEIISILPQSSQPLNAQFAFEIDVKVHYKIVSAESALFVSYLERFSPSDNCATGYHETMAVASPNQIPIKKGEGYLNYKIQFDPSNYGSKLFSTNQNTHAAIGASLWAGFDSQNRVIMLVSNLWDMKNYCYTLNF